MKKCKPHLKRIGLAACLAIVLIPSAGCVSKKTAQAHARAAYLAGQRDAFAEMQRQNPNAGSTGVAGAINVASNITIVGPVANPVVNWRNGLTLAQAILDAVYQTTTDPAQIVIKRADEEIRIAPSQLLNGTDVPLMPGDVVLIQLPAE